jgi:plasmid stabilization system protein ParE
MAAASFAHEVDHAVGEIRDHPERYRETGDGTRRFFLRRFPFTIVYRLSNEVITIIAVAHQKRRPRYWSDR